MTETWLTDSDTDKGWKSCTLLNNSSLRMDTSNRIGQQGGGLALVYSSMLNVTKVDEENKSHSNLPFGKYPVKNTQSPSLVFIIHHIPMLISVLMQCFWMNLQNGYLISWQSTKI